VAKNLKKRELVFGILCVLLAILCGVRLLFVYQSSFMLKVFMISASIFLVILIVRIILFFVKPYNWLYVAYYLILPIIAILVISFREQLFNNLLYIMEYLLPFIFIFMADYLIGQYAKANKKNRTKQVEKLKQQLTELENITER